MLENIFCHSPNRLGRSPLLPNSSNTAHSTPFDASFISVQMLGSWGFLWQYAQTLGNLSQTIASTLLIPTFAQSASHQANAFAMYACGSTPTLCLSLAIVLRPPTTSVRWVNIS